MKKLIETAPRLTATIIGATILISLVHEIGYFQVIGSEFMQLMSATDYIVSAIRWIPNGLLTLFVVIVWKFFWDRAEDGLSEEEIEDASPNPLKTYWFRQGPILITMAIFLLFGPLFLLFIPHAPFAAAACSFIVIWGAFSLWVVRHPRLEKRFPGVARNLFVLGPIVVCSVFALGLDEGEAALNDSQGEFKISIRDGTAIENAQVLRIFADGVLIRRPDNNKISYITWADVKEIGRTGRVARQYNRACQWFDISCPKILNQEETLVPSIT